MRIATNLSALNSYNHYVKNERNKNSVLEKLSSGLRINRASDDAAGLSISEKMSAQIRGLSQAARNIQDGVSLVQTAEAGLANIQASPLQRMRELLIQAANDTLTASDRAMIQGEVEQIKQDIDSIANSTTFNGINLLNALTTSTFVGYESTKSVIDLSKVATITLWEKGTSSLYGSTYSISSLLTDITWRPPDAGVPPAEEYVFSIDLTNNTFTSRAKKTASALPLNEIISVRVEGLIPTDYDVSLANASILVSYTGSYIAGHSPAVAADPINYSNWVQFDSTNPSDTTITLQFMAKKALYETVSDNLHLQVGPNAPDTYQIKLSDVRTTTLGVDTVSATTSVMASQSLAKVDKALEMVSGERSKYGSYNDALEHIANNVSTYELNLTDARSRITDADMALEIMEYTKCQLLSQSATMLMATSNTAPEKVLVLLKDSL